MHPLSNVYVWHVFRLFLEGAFGVYSKQVTLLKELGFQGSESVLDVGCGTGEHAEVTTGRYLGVDLDLQYIEFARRHHPSKEFACGDAVNLSMNSSPFEACLLIDVIHHLPDEQVRKMLFTLARLPIHRLYVFDPVVQSPPNRVGRWIVSRDRGRHVRSRNQLLELLNSVFVINTVRDLKTMLVEGVCAVGQPRCSGMGDC